MKTDKNTIELKLIKAVLVNDNSCGDNDQYWTFAYTDSNDDWYDNDSGQKILEYEGDKILQVVELNDCQETATPTLKSSDGLVDQIEVFIQKHYVRETIYSCRDVAKQILSFITTQRSEGATATTTKTKRGSVSKDKIIFCGGTGNISQDSLDKINAFTEKIIEEQKGLEGDVVKHVNDNLFDLLCDNKDSEE